VPLDSTKEHASSCLTGTALLLAATIDADELIVQKLVSEQCMALVKHDGLLITGTEMVLSPMRGEQVVKDTKDEIVAAWKASKPCLAMIKYRGSSLPNFASAPPASVDQNLAEFSQILSISDKVMSFVPILPRSTQNPIEAAKVGLEIPIDQQDLSLTVLRNLPDELPLHDDLQNPLPAVPTHEPAERERMMTVYEAPFTPRREVPPGYRFNTVIGVTPLRALLATFADANASTYSRYELIEAWITLSNTEREDLDIGRANAWTAAQVWRSKHLAGRIYLGRINLEEFLKMIHFDAQGNASVDEVFNAWEDCADIDEKSLEMEMSHNTTSKAKE
jgi:hypothetical protein